MIPEIITTDRFHHVEHVMGMPISFDIRPPVPHHDVVRDAVGWLHHVDTTFSTYQADSVITRIGRGLMDESEAPIEVLEVLAECRRLTRLTNGAFDAFNVPSPSGTMLDPSGLVKGWAVKGAADILEDAGAENYCINAAGDIALGGTAEPDRPWTIGVRHPRVADMLATTLRLAGPVGIATSARYERGDHIVDPRNGQPARAMVSATVFGPDLGLADAYATSLFVMGPTGLGWIAEQPGYEAYIITNDDMTSWTEGFGTAWPNR